MRRSLWLSCVLLCFATSASPQEAAPPAAVSVDELLEKAVAAYQAGLDGERRDTRLEGFRRAELLFAQARLGGAHSAALYANLGNAALQAEHLGPAVLSYRRALRIDPGYPVAKQNLDHARQQLPQWVPVPAEGGAFDSFFFWHRSVPADRRALFAAACFALASMLGAASIVRRSGTLRNAALIPLLAWIALVVSVALDPARTAAPEGVVIAQDAVARAADSGNAPLRFADPVPGGTEVRILEDRGRWLQIALHNGRTAWVNASTVGRVVPVALATDETLTP
jgi:hypothetical protein